MTAQVLSQQYAPPAVLLRRTLHGVVALAFAAAAVAKLVGAPPMIAVFAQIGIGQWFRYAVGAIELCGSILLLWPNRALHGALVLTATMAGALFTHLAVIGGMWQPAALLFVLSAALAWLNRHQRPSAR